MASFFWGPLPGISIPPPPPGGGRARRGHGNNGVDVGYNVQTAVDAKHKLILDFEVTAQPNDLGQLGRMSIRAKELCDVEEIEVVAGKGYYQASELKERVENGITPYVPKQIRSNRTGDRDSYADKFKYDRENTRPPMEKGDAGTDLLSPFCYQK